MATDDVAVVMVPLPAQGHLNQFLHLSRVLVSCGLAVHYVGSATHNRQVRERAENSLGSAGGIYFHDLPLPHFSSPAPTYDAGVNFPGHLQPAFDAALHVFTPLADFLRSLAASSRRVVLIHDSSMTFTSVAGASLPNVESFCFHTISAISGFLYRCEGSGSPREKAIEHLKLPRVSNEGCITEEFKNFFHSQRNMFADGEGRLLNTCRAIEDLFIDLIAREPGWEGKKTFTIGPLHQTAASENRGVRHGCVEWLDQQPLGSVLYVSFGTTSTFSDEQVAELAAGLEASGRRFLWVLRAADRCDIFSEDAENKRLPPEFYARVEGRGMVVRGWAPQVEILSHPATGGFMSHCGWNSCIESFAAGVPILAWPMHSDQPRNALLVTHLLRVGFPARNWETRAELVPAEAVRDAVEQLMGEEGEEVKRRARELAAEVRQSTSEGGSSKADLDAFVAHIAR
ncbi:zeatin O-glucosyltransferase-like [Zingiber officinale]|uniref:Glycosyltransferase n=1 Tax=Zingiber officinale TaxID=94328 RepID=A0A8J5KZZ7_ZINOF|nr:zeatin O-glucosyltransferase-like [Zingiber officinale]KAG6496181.1 hypothetical protein ZIOFF_044029 [Zingiber officinale]